MNQRREKMSSLASLARISSLVNSDPPSETAATWSLSISRTVVQTSALNATVTVGAINTGMLTVVLPSMGDDLHLLRSLLL